MDTPYRPSCRADIVESRGRRRTRNRANAQGCIPLRRRPGSPRRPRTRGRSTWGATTAGGRRGGSIPGAPAGRRAFQSLVPRPDLDAEGRLVGVLHLFGARELRRVDGRRLDDAGAIRDLVRDDGHVDAVDEVHGVLVDARAADEPQRAVLRFVRECRRGEDVAAANELRLWRKLTGFRLARRQDLVERAARHDDVRAAWKRLADGLEGEPTHDDGRAERHALEPLEVTAVAPRNGAVLADDSRGRLRPDHAARNSFDLHRCLPPLRADHATRASLVPQSRKSRRTPFTAASISASKWAGLWLFHSLTTARARSPRCSAACVGTYLIGATSTSASVRMVVLRKREPSESWNCE